MHDQIHTHERKYFTTIFSTVGEDFIGVPEALIFAEPSVCIGIGILDDDIHEMDEYISLEMVTAQLPSNKIGEVNVIISTGAKVVIVEDDG